MHTGGFGVFWCILVVLVHFGAFWWFWRIWVHSGWFRRTQVVLTYFGAFAGMQPAGLEGERGNEQAASFDASCDRTRALPVPDFVYAVPDFA